MTGLSPDCGLPVVHAVASARTNAKAPVAVAPIWGHLLERTSQRTQQMRWVIGIVFILLGSWSIWFGLFVDPVNWSGL